MVRRLYLNVLLFFWNRTGLAVHLDDLMIPVGVDFGMSWVMGSRFYLIHIMQVLHKMISLSMQ